LQKLNGKYRTRLDNSDEKRTAVLELRRNKIKVHLDKVEEIRKLKNKEKEQDIKKQKTELEHKLE
jgi:hypothetical protein